jgi:type IV pilus assembly protein PilB
MVGDREFAHGRGCDRCHHTGYKGRMALFEIMVMNDTLAQGMNEGWSLGELRARSREFGMRTLRDSGVLAVLDGVTTAEEVVRETLSSL